MVWKIVKVIMLRLLENALRVKKLDVKTSTHAPPGHNFLPGSCPHPSGRRKLPIHPGSLFTKPYFSSSQRREEIDKVL